MSPDPHKLQSELLERLKSGNTGQVDSGNKLPPASRTPVRYRVNRPVSGQVGSHFLTMSAFLLASTAAALAFESPWLITATGIGLAGTALYGAFRFGQRAKAPSYLADGDDAAIRTAFEDADSPGPVDTVETAQNARPEELLDRDWETGETSAQIAAMFDALGDMFATLSPQGLIISTNATFLEACIDDDPIGKTLAEAGINLQETTGGIEVHTGKGTDARIWAWRQTAARQADHSGLVIHAVGRDVTAERAAKALLYEAKAKAESANQAKTRFLATVSHEIRTPLNGILGMTHLLGQTEVTPEQASYLKTVGESGHSLLQLIEDLLDATSIEAGHFHLREQECNPRELVQESCELMAAQAHEKGLEIASHIDSDIPELIVTDPGRVKQMLFNLIGNAIKFTSQGGILVEVERDDTSLVFHVSDTGPGLKPEDHERIFGEFERADNSTTRKHGGAGLGLAISSKIAAALGGSISLRSALDEGSRFTITIPLCAARPGHHGPSLLGDQPLAGKSALILAPKGPGAETLVRTIVEFGGTAKHIENASSLPEAIAGMGHSNITDLLVDRRLAQEDPEGLRSLVETIGEGIAKTILIAPEDSRDLALAPELEAGKWLVRPVRASSLIKVLTHRDDRAERDRATGKIANANMLLRFDTPTFDILLAEDNPVNALVVRTMLARQGHRVTLVEDGRELVNSALDRPEGKCRYDLVITDLSMPELDGREAIAQIRATEAAAQLSKLPILVLSADGQAETCDELLALGADGHAEKPVDPDWLISLVDLTASVGRRTRDT